MNEDRYASGVTIATMGVAQLSLQKAKIKGHSVVIRAGEANFAVSLFHLGR